MAWSSKVVWSEGMFLRPQHFQQQDRFIEFVTHARALPMEGFFWGFRELTLDITGRYRSSRPGPCRNRGGTTPAAARPSHA